MGSFSSSSWITGEELKAFHWIEREIFSRLVFKLGYNIVDSFRVIGLWLWLEEVGLYNLILILQTKPDFIVNLVADEAVNCLNRLEAMIRSEQSQSQSQPLNNNKEEGDIFMGFTLGLFMNSVSLSPRFFSQKKFSAIRSVNRFVSDVATRAFDDIIHKVQVLGGFSRFRPFGGGDGLGTSHLGRSEAQAQPSLRGPTGTGLGSAISPQPMIPSAMESRLASLLGRSHSQFVVGGPSSSGSNPLAAQPPNVVGGASSYGSNPMVAQPPNVVGGPSSYVSNPMPDQPANPIDLAAQPPNVVGGPPNYGFNLMAAQPPTPPDLQITNADDRTLFVTFSRGYPITEGELREYFTSNFGDCIENIYLKDMHQPYEQALFALVVVRSASLLDMILQGSEDGKVKFVINGKHARVRKYMTKGST